MVMEAGNKNPKTSQILSVCVRGGRMPDIACHDFG